VLLTWRAISARPQQTVFKPSDVLEVLNVLRRTALEGRSYCFNEGCEVVGQLKQFKVCPQCKTARYCAPRVRHRIGQRVGTRRRVAHSVTDGKSRLYKPSSMYRLWEPAIHVPYLTAQFRNAAH
jgi:hypothetical protein